MMAIILIFVYKKLRCSGRGRSGSVGMNLFWRTARKKKCGMEVSSFDIFKLPHNKRDDSSVVTIVTAVR